MTSLLIAQAKPLVNVLLLCLCLLPRASWGQDPLFSCNFEENLCNFVQEINDDLDWERRIQGTPTGLTGPSAAQSGVGYAYVETSSPAGNNHSAGMYTSVLEYTGSVCVTFYYHMYGEDINKLQVYRRALNGERTTVYEKQGNQGNQWIEAQVTVTLISSTDRIGFEAHRGLGYRGDIAIDSVVINRRSCETIESLPLECSFETETICNFIQSEEDDFDWLRLTGSTPTENSGPDSAANGQYYMYIEASDPRKAGDRAIIQSPSLDVSGDACLEFSYHMYGEYIDRLIIYTTSRGQSNPWRTFTGASSPNANMWKTDKVQLQLQREDRVGFIGVRGGNVQGDIAIDNVRIYAGQCEDVVFPPGPSPPPPGERGLPFTCSFETDFCMMFQRTNDNFDWTRNSGGTDSEGTGPTSARVGSFYAYAEASNPRAVNDRAFLETPSLIYTGRICVSFYYHMSEIPVRNDMGTLTVYRYREEQGDTSIFTREGDQGNNWLKAEIDTDIQQRDKIVFSATRGQDIRSDIAVDGIDIRQGNCETESPSPAPSPGPGTSTPEGIIYNMYSCGGEGEGSSSSNCRMRQDLSDNMQWSLMSGRTPSGGMYTREIDEQFYPVTGPDGAAVGSSYLYMEASGKTSGQIARLLLEGSDFTRSGDACLRFQYSMNGHHMGELRVYVIQNGVREVKWSLAGDQKQGWKRAAVDIDMNGVSQVGVEGTVGKEFSGDMALDDIRMSSGRCEATPSDLIWRCNFETSSGESSFCNMEQDTRDTSGFDWLLWQGMTPSKETGPESAQNGAYYIFIEASKPRVTGDRASIFLPVLNRSGTVCLQYYYNMYGFHMGSLEVYIRRGSTDMGVINSLSGQKGTQWQENRVTINNLQNGDKIGFRGIRGTEYSGDLALDNIRVRSGSC